MGLPDAPSFSRFSPVLKRETGAEYPNMLFFDFQSKAFYVFTPETQNLKSGRNRSPMVYLWIQ